MVWYDFIPVLGATYVSLGGEFVCVSGGFGVGSESDGSITFSFVSSLESTHTHGFVVIGCCILTISVTLSIMSCTLSCSIVRSFERTVS